MTCKDLMVGDLVQGHLPNTPSKVVGIPNEYRIAVITPGGAYMELSIDDFLPISITPEILEKSGFTRDDSRIKYFTESDDYYDSAIHEITDSIWCFEYQNCEAHFPPCCMLISHVHELQHALRLCGIEKEIVL